MTLMSSPLIALQDVSVLVRPVIVTLAVTDRCYQPLSVSKEQIPRGSMILTISAGSGSTLKVGNF
jgi:hypothetical protein